MMGNTQSVEIPANDNSDIEIYPWFELIQWAAEDIPSETIFQYDIQKVQTAVKYICQSEQAYLSECKANGYGIDLDCFETIEENPHPPVWREWASSLIDQIPELNEIRFKLVPGKMTEKLFWERFFSGCKNAIIKTISSHDNDTLTATI